jgi:hypothetical protein
MQHRLSSLLLNFYNWCKRKRTIYLFLGSVLVLAVLFWTDPDQGVSTGILVLGIAVCLLAVAFAHIARKALTDYAEADMQSLFKRAKGSPTGAGLALVALAIMLSALLSLFGSQVHAATLDGLNFLKVGEQI